MGFISCAPPPVMLISRREDAVLVWAPAKINLFLEVLAKRTDGYHEIATIMVAVSLYDVLAFSRTEDPSIQLSCDDEGLGVGTENLVSRAAGLLKDKAGTREGARIHLSKRIPMAAGLGGGSSDAAATLAGLNALWELGRSTEDLAGLGAELGSDVPFFFSAPAALCTGRGERIEKLHLGRPLWLVLVCPQAGLATAAVYAAGQVPAKPVAHGPLATALGRGEIKEVGRLLHNRLQEPADRLNPDLLEVKGRLASQMPTGVLMSGSGTSCFALCQDQKEARQVACGLARIETKAKPGRVFIVRSCL